ncbi:MCE family protein [Pedococcus sp. KACC 23699]|uniref:MCE family protein n=1 Tax=Pedococcus sp. KACC 23699 TaxID=3149228 RepID=A0AAU7JPV7_9MICO
MADTTAVGPAKGVLSRLGNKAYGVGFIAVVALLVGLSIASFQKRFTPVVTVTLLTDRIGSQLQTSSDVKLRGLIVGEVRSIRTTGDGASLQLALQPEMARLIPANVHARLLPKTLFGERFVDLVSPDAGGSGRTIAEGDTIGQDRSSVAIELEKVFADLLPLLRAVKPERLSATLNALASALEGRGTRLGQNLVLVDSYFKEINPKMPVIQADISGLADLASTYAVAAPDLVRAASTLATTNTTIVQKKDVLAGFLAGTAGFANEASGFLEANGERIIRVGQVQRPTVAVLARYSPQYPCFTQALVNWQPRIDEAFRDRQFHITVEVAPQRPGYTPGEEPRWGETRGPNCLGLPNPGGSQANPHQGPHFNDGTNAGGSSAGSALPSAFAGASGSAIVGVDSGLAGTEEEQRVVAALLSADGSAKPSAITTLLAGPMLRGSVVSQQ